MQGVRSYRRDGATVTAYIGSHCEEGTRTTYKTPWGMTVSVNKAVLKRFRLACKRAERCGWDPKRIDSYACRNIRGSDSWSRHSYAAAWDFFYTGPGVPPPGGVWKPENTFGNRFALCFTDLGFTWGSQWARQDWPHVEWSGSTVPTLTGGERLSTYRAYAKRMGRKQRREARKVRRRS